ncbi:MAG TPA: ATP-binding cassette domain-containing protein [Micropepsaceae bacterium]|nr:ATP-binding cassette domain-containing protein [Micropepsaceae bacterium]
MLALVAAGDQPIALAASREWAASGAALELHGVSVTLDNGRPIVRRADLSIAAGEHVMLMGDSGSGKSSLVRALAGCWPWGSGEIRHPERQRIFVVPQRPYVPAGSLRDALVYPAAPHEMDGDEAADALAAAGLGHLGPQLDLVAPWVNILSEGEKQRLAIARLLLHRPDIVVLDEATSALHVAGQAEVMQAIERKLPGVTIISVGHRPTLEKLHSRRLTMAWRPGGARIVKDAPILASKESGATPVQKSGIAAVGSASKA